ncbi:MAG: hypothetical protein LBU08_01415 [Tannerellaceae bacterium]|jgi:thiamine kinase-like enzyme|nr:hypothetical protein [Tannerellaceae bacterium]
MSDDLNVFIEKEYSAFYADDVKDARGYHRSAGYFAGKGEGCASLTYHVASMALERYLVALCHLHCQEPGNHNFIALMQTVERYVDFPHELSRAIRALDHRFGLCSLDTLATDKPLTVEDASHVMDIVSKVSKMVV